MNEKTTFEKIEEPSITVVPGIRAAAVNCGLKKKKSDLALVCSESEAAAAGVFTRNRVQAAPVKLCRETIGSPVRALVVNSGKIAAGIKGAAAALSGDIEAGHRAACAIMTTDRATKEVAYRSYCGGRPFHLAGMAKGSGMICPDMATMLAFLYTDLAIPRPLLQELLQEAVDRSFNLITIDGDTSTNDTVLLMANGAAGLPEVEAGDGLCRTFAEMLEQACFELAYQIVSDGEGVTKVITLELQGAPDRAAARTLARAVLNSPLVKTAFYGEDANWGRILAALGYAGVEFDPDRVDIYLGPLQVASQGGAVAFRESEARSILKKREITVRVELNSGNCSLTAWGTDLSHDYISINSSYRS